jgi:hypothetical protein
MNRMIMMLGKTVFKFFKPQKKKNKNVYVLINIIYIA